MTDCPALSIYPLVPGDQELLANTLSGLRILLLEDEYLIAMDVELLCREHGAAEITVMLNLDGLDGDAPLPDFDVAILDLMLAGRSTMPFAERLEKIGRPFVFATGYSRSDELLERMPAVPVIEKPYAGTDLVMAVASVTGRLRP